MVSNEQTTSMTSQSSTTQFREDNDDLPKNGKNLEQLFITADNSKCSKDQKLQHGEYVETDSSNQNLILWVQSNFVMADSRGLAKNLHYNREGLWSR